MQFAADSHNSCSKSTTAFTKLKLILAIFLVFYFYFIFDNDDFI